MVNFGRRRSIRSAAALVLATGFAATTGGALRADVLTWVYNSADSSWESPSNWSTAIAPVSTDDVVFSTPTAAQAIVLSNDESVNSITLSNAATAYTYSGGALTVGAGGLTGTSNGAATFSNNIVLGASQSWSVGTGKTVTVSGVVSGADNTVALTKTGAGTVALSGLNTYAGGTTLSAGTLSVAGTGTASSGALGTGTLTVTGTSTLTETAAAKIYNNIVVNSGVTLTLSSYTNNLTLAGNISGSGNIFETGNTTAGTYFIGDNSGFSGTFTSEFYSGNHRVRFNAATAGSASAAWVMNNSNTDGYGFNFGTGTISFGSLAGGGKFRNDASNSTVTMSIGNLNTNTTWSGVIMANSAAKISVNKIGTGTLTFSGANTFTGTTTISNGTLQLSNANAIAATTGITISGGTLSSSLATSVSLGTGAVSMSAGGISANGNGVGLFTLGSNASFTATGGTLFETIASAASYDKITTASGSTGTASLSGVTIDLSSSTGIDYTATYALFTNFASINAADTTITGYDTANYIASLSDTGVLSFAAAIPEPASLGILTIAALGMLTLGRRK